MTFASDNWAGASDHVMAVLAEANADLAAPYGADPWTQRAEAALSAFFERDVAAAFVATGSAANALALAELYRPGGVVLAHIDSHIARDEAGAPLLYAPGMVLELCDGEAGRIDVDTAKAHMARFAGADPKVGRALALSFSNVNELGQSYGAAEASALAAAARAAGLAVHVDGARFMNALAFTGASPAALTWGAGVDILSLGLTKTGGWCAEAVVFFEPEAAREARYRHKQAAHLFSKNRFVAAQFMALLSNGHGLALAEAANGRAAEVAAAVSASSEAALAVPCESNEVFAFVSPAAEARLAGAGLASRDWTLRSRLSPEPPEPGWRLKRLVASFRTTADQVTALRNALG